MPYRCCVPLCKANHPTGPTATVFSFPADEELQNKWLAAIKREGFFPSKYSKVCERHFHEGDIQTAAQAFDERSGKLVTVPLKLNRLKPGAVPSIFPEYPKYLTSATSKRISPDEKRCTREMANVNRAVQDSMEVAERYNAARTVSSIDDLKKSIETFGLPQGFAIHQTSNSVCIYKLEFKPYPKVMCSVVVDSELKMTAFLRECMLKKIGTISLPLTCSHFNELIEVLETLQKLQKNEKTDDIKAVVTAVVELLQKLCDSENNNIITFLVEQVKFLLCPKNNLVYSPDLMIFAIILHSISPHAYKFVRSTGYVRIPHPSTLKNVCSSLNVSPQNEMLNHNFLMYIRSRFSYLHQEDKTVILLIDEIYVKPYFDFKGGCIVGAAANFSNIAATSAFVFMISSMLSPFREVAHIVPVKDTHHNFLPDCIKKVIMGLEAIGFTIICVVMDNNSINRKAMSLFAAKPQLSFVYPHSNNPGRPLFFISDPVHLFKNIRNNWLNQKNEGKCILYPNFDQDGSEMPHTASFDALRDLYRLEANSLVRYNHSLSLKSLWPTNLERQNVGLALKIFNKFVVNALKELGEKFSIKHHMQTSEFIRIICTWWDIMNVKTPGKGIRLRSEFMKPITCEVDEKVMFLNKFLDWLDKWKAQKTSTGKLSSETHDALKLTTQGMLELASYCFNELNMLYLLPGKVQTDALEQRFGRYRQLAGSQYHISVSQLLECEKKLRVQSHVKMELQIGSKVVPVSDLDVPDTWNEINEEREPLFIRITDENIECAQHYLPVVTYLAGYCCHSVLKKLKCEDCRDRLLLNSRIELSNSYSMIRNLDRGGLLCPKEDVVTIVFYSYVLIQNIHLNHEEFFLKSPDQRLFLFSTTYRVLQSKEMLLDYECLSGHIGENISKMLIWVATNIMLKNLCSRKNDVLNKQRVKKKRKMQTLQHC